MSMWWRYLLLTLQIGCVALLTACGQSEPMRNVRLEQAADHSHRAQRAFERGDYLTAMKRYEAAFELDVALENEEGIAIDALNLARVNQMLGRTEQAHAYLDGLLQDRAIRYADKYLAVAALRKSLLMLEQGDTKVVAAWLDKAVVWCGKDCAVEGAIDNVRAALALREGDAVRAAQWAERAMSETKDSSSLEYANALRYLAEARLMSGEHAVAARVADEVLALDKAMGAPEKIKLDLLLNARVHAGMGDTDEAARFNERASRIRTR
ncbi:MAG: hypothetical protein AB1722_09545 [Pseudomonadota bacterium]